MIISVVWGFFLTRKRVISMLEAVAFTVAVAAEVSAEMIAIYIFVFGG